MRLSPRMLTLCFLDSLYLGLFEPEPIPLAYSPANSLND